MELTEQQVEGLMNEHIQLGEQIRELKKKQDAAKAQFTEWLDNAGATKVSTATFIAKLTTRKGGFDVKAYQVANAVPDSELAKYKKSDSKFWTVKKK